MNTVSESDAIDNSLCVPESNQMANDELILSPKKHLVCFATVKGDCLVTKNGASYAGIKECLLSERMVDKIEPVETQIIDPTTIPDPDIDSGMESSASSWDRSVSEVKEHAFARLENELRKANETLKLRDEEVSRLSRIRADVESELEELTASLFQVNDEYRQFLKNIMLLIIFCFLGSS